MARRTAAEIYRDLTGAGWDTAGAVVMTAIALAETGGDTEAFAAGEGGRRAYGAYLIAVDPAATGTGGPRDVAALTASPRAQAAAAYTASSGGDDFTGWASWRDGSYQAYLGQAHAAAGTGPGDLLTAEGRGQLLTGGRHLLIEGAVLALGLALVGVGLYRAVGTGLARRAGRAVKAVI